MKRIFEAEVNKQTGKLGWHLQSVPKFDPRDGEGVAHDTMEHRAHTDISIEEELIAFGTSLVTRDNTSEMFGQLLKNDFFPLLATARLIYKTDPLSAYNCDPRIKAMVEPLWDHIGTGPDDLSWLQVANVRRWIEHGYELGKRRYAKKSNVHGEFYYLWTLGDLYLSDADAGDLLIVKPHDGGDRRAEVQFMKSA